MLSDFLFNHQAIDNDNFDQVLPFVIVDVTDDYPFPPEIASIDGTTIMTTGNFSASTGKPKSKKTFNLGAITAAALSGEVVLKYKVKLPKEKPKILYIDTEQSRPHCHKVLKRIFRLAGLPTDKKHKNLVFLALREYTPDQRRAIINLTLQRDNTYGLVIIDGVRDLMRDINNPGESLDVINDLMRWSSYYDLHIHTVLHLNKGDDNTRGHIGTELNNKAETVLQITKDPNDFNRSEVKAMHIRDKEFAPFAFEIDGEGLPQLVAGYEPGVQSKYVRFVKLPDEQHRKALELAFSDSKTYGYGEMVAALKKGYDEIGYTRGHNTLVKLLKYLIRNGAILKDDRKYTYNPDFELDGRE